MMPNQQPHHAGENTAYGKPDGAGSHVAQTIGGEVNALKSRMDAAFTTKGG